MRIALAGNPNSGKTTMYNALTGRNEKVGNWAGVTVDKKESAVKKKYAGKQSITVVDLPGAYSMSPFTAEESVTSEYINNEKPDVIINIVDGTNLSRSLFFTTQLLELGVPVVIALNKEDINESKETEIDAGLLSELLCCPVYKTVSTSSNGLKEVVTAALSLVGQEQKKPYLEEPFDRDDRDAVKEADKKRFAFVNDVVSQVENRKVHTKDKTLTDKIDAVLTNRFVGIPIFAVVMFLVFWISQVGPGVWIAEGLSFSNGFTIPGLVTLLELFKDWVGGFFTDASPILQSLLLDGVLGGAIAVVGFLPLVMVMYFLIALLEDCGYMARVSVVLDPIFKKVGLSGKSVIPFVIGTGCAIPGVMACRTVRDEKERRATAMLAPFMPCGAKLPVIALFAGAFFSGAAWVGPLMYFLGIAIILVGAYLIKLVNGVKKKKKNYFIMELPEYKVPSFTRALKSMCARGWSYVVKAGTVILLCNTAVQIMQTFTLRLDTVEEGAANTSILATVASPVAFLIAPVIGFAAWQLAAAVITGFIAKENVVGTLAVCFGISNLINVEELVMNDGAAQGVASAFGLSAVGALAYLMFNLFSPPCFAAIGAMNSEIKNKKWLFAGIGLQLSVGYVLSFLVYFFGTLFTKGALVTDGGYDALWMPIVGWIVTLSIVSIFALLIYRANRGQKKTVG